MSFLRKKLNACTYYKTPQRQVIAVLQLVGGVVGHRDVTKKGVLPPMGVVKQKCFLGVQRPTAPHPMSNDHSPVGGHLSEVGQPACGFFLGGRANNLKNE